MYTNTHSKILPDGTIIDIWKLLKQLSKRKPSVVDIDSVVSPSRSKRSGFSKKRYESVKTEHPIILNEAGQIIDGRHRYFKHLDEGKKKIHAIVVTEAELRRASVKSEEHLIDINQVVQTKQ